MVYSLTPFFNELDILEIRLATLDEVVDFHVIGESNLTHSGHEKPLFFKQNAARFEKWKKKLIPLEIDLRNPPERDEEIAWVNAEYQKGLDWRNNWFREKEQRRALIDGLEPRQGDLILLSDVDEIPHPKAVENASLFNGFDNNAHILLCRVHVAKLNWRWKQPAHESHSICRIFPAYYVNTQGDLEYLRLTHMPPIGPPGWHLGWMQGIGQKAAAFVHQEMVPDLRPEEAIAGRPLFPNWIRQELEWCDLDQLPPYVKENKEKFQYMMVENPNV